MIDPQKFVENLLDNEISFFAGVPDSLLSEVCYCIADLVRRKNNILSVNEGNAIGHVIGYNLSTNKIGLCYMQNSGLGNAINPLVSLADAAVYRIPMILLIGWRGAPGVRDEPQHAKDGLITTHLLEILGIPYEIIGSKDCSSEKILSKALRCIKTTNLPYAILVQKGAFSSFQTKKVRENKFTLTREEALEEIIDTVPNGGIFVASTGKISRELFELRTKKKMDHGHDFFVIGGMGHCSSIAFSIAKNKPNKTIYCIEGDGSFLMHMGSLPVIGEGKPINFYHIVLNNGAHDSVGGQKTVALETDLVGIAKSCNYQFVERVINKSDLKRKIKIMIKSKGPSFIEVGVASGSRKDLGRPRVTPKEMKEAFMKILDSK